MSFRLRHICFGERALEWKTTCEDNDISSFEWKEKVELVFCPEGQQSFENRNNEINRQESKTVFTYNGVQKSEATFPWKHGISVYKLMRLTRLHCSAQRE